MAQQSDDTINFNITGNTEGLEKSLDEANKMLTAAVRKTHLWGRTEFAEVAQPIEKVVHQIEQVSTKMNEAVTKPLEEIAASAGVTDLQVAKLLNNLEAAQRKAAQIKDTVSFDNEPIAQPKPKSARGRKPKNPVAVSYINPLDNVAARTQEVMNRTNEISISQNSYKKLTENIKAADTAARSLETQFKKVADSVSFVNEASAQLNTTATTSTGRVVAANKQVSQAYRRVAYDAEATAEYLNTLRERNAQIQTALAQTTMQVKSASEALKEATISAQGMSAEMRADYLAPFGQRMQQASESANVLKAELKKVEKELNTYRQAEAMLKPDSIFPDLTAEGSALNKVSKQAESHQKSINKATTAEKQKGDQSTNLTAKLNKETKAFHNSGRAGANSADLLSKAFKTLAGISIGAWLADAVNETVRFQEAFNLYRVAVQDAYTETDKFIDKVTEMYGLSRASVYDTVGTFANLGTALNLNSSYAAHLATNLTKVGVDLASLFNKDLADVFGNLESGLQGMTRAVRKYGMDIRTVALQETAWSLGIQQRVRDMSEINRVALRYITMVRQASNASEDFARNIEMPAVQLKVFREQMIELGRSIGQFFIGTFGRLLPYLNGFVMALRAILDMIAALLGIEIQLPEFGAFTNLEDGFAGVGEAADAAAKKVQKFLAPFDDLIIISETLNGAAGSIEMGIGGGTLDPLLAQALLDTEAKMENIRMKALDIRDAVLEFFGLTWDPFGNLQYDPIKFMDNLIAKFPFLEKSIKALFKNWDEIVAGFKAVWEALIGVIQRAWEKLQQFIGTYIDPRLAEWIDGLGGGLQSLAEWITRNEELLANFVLALGALFIVSSIAQAFLNFVALVTGPIGQLVALAGVLAIAWTFYEEEMTRVFESVLAVFDHFLQFLAGVFTGDTERAAIAIENIFIALGNGIIAAITTAINAAIDLLNGLFNFTTRTINSIGEKSEEYYRDKFGDALESPVLEERELFKPIQLPPAMEYRPYPNQAVTPTSDWQVQFPTIPGITPSYDLFKGMQTKDQQTTNSLLERISQQLGDGAAVYLDDKVLGDFVRDQVNNNTASAGRTVYHN